jgi:hypothetical protein
LRLTADFHVVYHRYMCTEGMLDEVQDIHPGACTMIFACGPGRMVNQLWDEATQRNSKQHRVDFVHEEFEF